MFDSWFLMQVPEGDRVVIILRENMNKPENIYIIKESEPFVIFATSNSLSDAAGEIYMYRWPKKDRKEWIKNAGRAVLLNLRNGYAARAFAEDDDELVRNLMLSHLYDFLKKAKDGGMSLAMYRRNYEEFENKGDKELEMEGEAWKEEAVYGFFNSGQIRVFNERHMENTKMYDFGMLGAILPEEKRLRVITTMDGDLFVQQKLLYYIIAAALEEGLEVAEIAEEWLDFIINPGKFKEA